jgi:hypothetical protein
MRVDDAMEDREIGWMNGCVDVWMCGCVDKWDEVR